MLLDSAGLCCLPMESCPKGSPQDQYGFVGSQSWEGLSWSRRFNVGMITEGRTVYPAQALIWKLCAEWIFLSITWTFLSITGVHPYSGWMVLKVVHLHFLCFNRYHSFKTPLGCERRAPTAHWSLGSGKGFFWRAGVSVARRKADVWHKPDLTAYQHSESLHSKDSPLPSSANMAVDFGKVASKIFSTVASWSCPSGFPVLMFYLPSWKQPGICGWAHSSDENVQRLSEYWHDFIRMSCMKISVDLGWSSAQSHWELGRAWCTLSDHWTYRGTHDFETWRSFPGF